MGLNDIKKQRGAAAIFIVVFFALLISIIALSFLRITIQDQQQATNNDLSKSAYDSAEAGLEDANRALSWYKDHCPINGVPSVADQPNCAAYANAFTATPIKRCNIADIITNAPATLPNAHLIAGSTEVSVSTNTGAGSNDKKLDQAYTCTTITPQTKDYQAVALDGKSDTLIPLRTVGFQQIDSIELNWFTDVDAGTNTPTFPIAPKLPYIPPKPAPSPWPPSSPPIMRFELIPVFRGAPGINIDDINKDTRTIFLYPSTTGVSNIPLTVEDFGRAQPKTNAPISTKCQPTLPSGPYDCSVKIGGGSTLPFASSGGTAANTDYYLRITSLYNNAHYQLRLLDSGGTAILFNNVEPEVDSTGRANDVFRRVQSRVSSITSSNPLTDGGFDVTKGLCKDFNVPIYSTQCADTNLVNP